MQNLKCPEHPLYPRIRRLRLPLHALRRLIGSKCICESGLSRALRGIDPLSDDLKASIEALLTELEQEELL